MKYIIDICYLHKHKHSQIDVDTGMHVNKSNELSDTMDGPSPIPSRYPWARRSMTSMEIATFFSLVRSFFVNVWEFLIGPCPRPARCFCQDFNVFSGQFRETP